MLAVAQRARASKETLYAWFGDRDGLFAALIERNADATVPGLNATFSPPSSVDDIRTTLLHYATALLTLLTGEPSVSLNRAAMANRRLAELLLRCGRHRAGPVVEDFLTAAHDNGLICAPDPAEAYGQLYGLIVRDSQIRVLLGEAKPSSKSVDASAAMAVEQFLQLRSTVKPAGCACAK